MLNSLSFSPQRLHTKDDDSQQTNDHLVNLCTPGLPKTDEEPVRGHGKGHNQLGKVALAPGKLVCRIACISDQVPKTEEISSRIRQCPARTHFCSPRSLSRVTTSEGDWRGSRANVEGNLVLAFKTHNISNTCISL